jgi:hypothetical protein
MEGTIKLCEECWDEIFKRFPTSGQLDNEILVRTCAFNFRRELWHMNEFRNQNDGIILFPLTPLEVFFDKEAARIERYCNLKWGVDWSILIPHIDPDYRKYCPNYVWGIEDFVNRLNLA